MSSGLMPPRMLSRMERQRRATLNLRDTEAVMTKFS